jgi:putative flippase GtrA
LLSIKEYKANVLKLYLFNVLRMGLWGLPGILLAFSLNFVLHKKLEVNIYLAYAIVISIVTALNYFVINNIVFKGKKIKSTKYRVGNYTLIVAGSKISEWALYSLIIYLSDIYFLVAQLFVSVIFVFIKYSSFKAVIK